MAKYVINAPVYISLLDLEIVTFGIMVINEQTFIYLIPIVGYLCILIS